MQVCQLGPICEAELGDVGFGQERAEEVRERTGGTVCHWCCVMVLAAEKRREQGREVTVWTKGRE